jgi:DNA invertase Pin-like site-specific DNA recombinase/uncharacterized protein
MKVAIYCRMSSDKQSKSIAQQLEQTRKLCRKRGYTIVHEYIDRGISGDKIKERPAFKRLLTDGKAKQFERVVCWDADRLGRFDIMAAGEVLNPIRRAGVSIETCSEGIIDLESFAGRIVYSVNQEARHQQSDISSNTLRGMTSKALLGDGYPGCRAPYGFIRKTEIIGRHRHSVLLVDPETAPVVKMIFEEYTKPGTSMLSVATLLNKKKIPSPSGREWIRSSLHKIIVNPVYKRCYQWGVRNSGRFSERDGEDIVQRAAGEGTTKQEPILHEDHEAIPEIISKALFEKAQQQLKHRQVATRKPCTSKRLSGLITCSGCGGNYQADGRGYFRCRGNKCAVKYRVSEGDMLGALVEVCNKELLARGKMKQREKEFNAWLKQMENEEKNSTVRASLEKRLAALENKVKAGSARLLSIPEDLLADATSALQEIKAERNAVSQELSRLGGDKMTNRQNDKTVSGYLDAVQQLARKLVKGDSAKVNAALREVGIRVLVKQNKSGVESVSVAVQPPEALVPIVNPMPFPQPVVPPKCFQATFSTDTST